MQIALTAALDARASESGQAVAEQATEECGGVAR
jgi:hypothetical protein